MLDFDNFKSKVNLRFKGEPVPEQKNGVDKADLSNLKFLINSVKNDMMYQKTLWD